MNVLAVRSPYLPQAKHSGIPKAAYGEQFSDILEKEQALSRTDEIAASETSKDPYGSSYTVTKEQAEYFREKYGKKYDEKKAEDFFLELSEHKIISWVDAFETLGLNTIIRAYGITEFINTETNTVSYITNSLKAPEYKKSYLTDTSFESAYVKFERQYDKAVETWQDYIQKQLDFYSYLIKSDEIPKDAKGKVPVSQSKAEWNLGFKSRYNTIEKVAGVTEQIFGEVSV